MSRKRDEEDEERLNNNASTRSTEIPLFFCISFAEVTSSDSFPP
jgi:hypothetical protein